MAVRDIAGTRRGRPARYVRDFPNTWRLFRDISSYLETTEIRHSVFHAIADARIIRNSLTRLMYCFELVRNFALFEGRGIHIWPRVRRLLVIFIQIMLLLILTPISQEARDILETAVDDSSLSFREPKLTCVRSQRPSYQFSCSR